ncbi:fatty-acid oxidation protein subunit alpha, partial [Cribrihabitans sp. XS_ASV171]
MTGPVLAHLGETKLELGPTEEVHTHPWRRAEADGVIWLVLDCEGSSTNTVSRAVIEGLEAELTTLEENTPHAVVIRSAKPGGFAAGADIGGFEEMGEEGAADLLKQGHKVLD